MATDGGVGYLVAVPSIYTGSGNPWIPDPDFPYCTIKYPDTSAARTGTFEIQSTAYFVLYNGSGYVPGINRLGDLPNGFQVTSISQDLNGLPANPQPTSVEPFLSSPFNIKAPFFPTVGSWDAWSADFGISNLDTTFVPATMQLEFLGPWNLVRGWSLNQMVDPPPYGALRVVATNQPINVFGDPLTPLWGDTTPLIICRFVWSYDTDACAGLTTPSSVTVTDPVTGAISWSLGLGADGTIIEVENSVGDIETYFQPSGVTTYTPTLTGDLTIRLYAATLDPICKSSPASVSVTVTVPLIFTMGEDGITTGIFLGGSAPLQFIGNPSGIYTLVPGKAYDTLYERIPTVTSQDVKIPDPFIKTAYYGE